MSEPKKPAFSAPAQMTWGPHGKRISVKNFKNCPEAIGPHFARFETDPASTLENVSKLFQRIEDGKCQGNRKNIPHLTYRSARSLITKQLEAHGRKALREWWSRHEKLATEFALEELDIYEDQFLDGFIPYNFFVKGARDYFGIKDGDLEDILSNAVHRMPQVVSDTGKENVLLHFPAELSFLEMPKNEKETKTQKDRQDELSKLVLKKLRNIFKDYEVTFKIATEKELQQTSPFITVKFTNDAQADDSKLGETETKDLPRKDWLKGLPGEGYKNLQHDEKTEVYLHSMYSRLKAETGVKKEKQIVIQARALEQVTDLKLERWARLIAYITTHELLHDFGIPHLDPPQGRAPLLMDEKIEFSLLSYWRGASDMAKIKDEAILRELLTPKQKAYLKFTLKKKAPANKTGYLSPRREKKTMGCKEINGRCYLRTGVGGPNEEYLDLYKDANQEVIGFGYVDPQDLYQPPGAKEFSPVQPDIPFREDREGRILSLGHFFGRPIRTLHVAYRDSYFTPHYSTADLLAITPIGLRKTEIALLSNDLFNFLIDDHIPDWEDPITDDQPPLRGILERLKKIALGKLKPPRVYKEDPKQQEYEYQNSRRAVEMIHFYWRLGSDEAGTILDSPKFRELLQQHHVERKDRFELIAKKLKEQEGQKALRLEGKQEPPPKKQNGGPCRAEGFYFDREEAIRCVEALNQKADPPYIIVDGYENIGDSSKPLVVVTYYKVIQGAANQK